MPRPTVSSPVAAKASSKSPSKSPAPPASPVPSLKLGKKGRRVVEGSTTARSEGGSALAVPVVGSATERNKVGRKARRIDFFLSKTTHEGSAAAVEGAEPKPESAPEPEKLSLTAMLIKQKEKQHADFAKRNTELVALELQKLALKSGTRGLNGNVFDLGHWKLGDLYVVNAIRGLQSIIPTPRAESEDDDANDGKSGIVEKIVLRDNRITDAGFQDCLQAIRSSSMTKQVVSLDVSENTMHRKGAAALALFIKTTPSLLKLDCSSMNMGDPVIAVIAKALVTDSNIMNLTLSRVKMGDLGAEAVAVALKAATCRVTSLDLSWNDIRTKGATAIFTAIASNASSSLTNLDVSWNSFGSLQGDSQREGASAMGNLLAKNSSLRHLDISQNNLTAEDCAIISVGLKENHSLLGLHLVGNKGRSDAYGYLLPDAKLWPLELSHVSTRVLDSKVSGRGEWALRSVCWVCGCFRESRFTYTTMHKDVAAAWARINADPNARLAILAAERAEASRKAKEIEAVRAADPLYDFNHEEEEEGRKVADLEPQKADDPHALKPLPKEYVLSLNVYLATSFDNWIPESMLQLSPENFEILKRDRPAGWVSADTSDPQADKESWLQFRRPVGALDEASVQAGLSREMLEVKGRRASPLKRGFVPPKTQHEHEQEQEQEQEQQEQEQEQEQLQEQPETDQVAAGEAFEEAPESSEQGAEDKGSVRDGDEEKEDNQETTPAPAAPAAAEVEVVDEAVQYRKMHTAGYDLWRMVPPGLHYFCFKVNDGPFFYDPWQPHVETSTLLELGLKVPKDVGMQLPAFVNTVTMPQPTEEERMRGVGAFVELQVLPRVRNTQTTTHQAAKVWLPKDSLFFPSRHLYEERQSMRCFNADWPNMRASKGRDHVVCEQLHSIIGRHYTVLRKVYETYAMLYSGELFFLGPGAFNELVTKCQILDGASTSDSAKESKDKGSAVGVPFPRSSSSKRIGSSAQELQQPTSGIPVTQTQQTPSLKGATRTELELIFVANAISGPRHEANTKRTLCRFQFLDTLIAAANVKFVKTGICKSLPSAVTRLISAHIEPLAEYERGNADFCASYLITEELDTVFKRQDKRLQKAFKQFSGAENNPNESKTMSFGEWISFCDAHQVSSMIGDRARQLAYIRAKVAVPDPFDESNNYKQATYLEFLCAIARAALQVKQNEDPSATQIPPVELVPIIDAIALKSGL